MLLRSRDESRERSRAQAQLGSSPGVALFLAHRCIWAYVHTEPSIAEQGVRACKVFALVLTKPSKWVLSDKD